MKKSMIAENGQQAIDCLWAVLSTLVFIAIDLLFGITPRMMEMMGIAQVVREKHLSELIGAVIAYVVCFAIRVFMAWLEPQYNPGKKLNTYFLIAGITASILIISDNELLKAGISPYVIVVFLIGIFISPLWALECEIKTKTPGEGVKPYEAILCLLSNTKGNFVEQFETDMYATSISIITAAILRLCAIIGR